MQVAAGQAGESDVASWLYFDMFRFYDWPFPHVYFAENVAYFHVNSWLSFQ